MTGCWWLVRQQGCEELGDGELGGVGQLRHHLWGGPVCVVIMVEHVVRVPGVEVTDLPQVGVDMGSVHDVFGGVSDQHEQHGQ